MPHDKPAVAEYSKQILEYMSRDDVQRLRVPCLAQLLVGLCRRYLEYGDAVGAMGAE